MRTKFGSEAGIRFQTPFESIGRNEAVHFEGGNDTDAKKGMVINNMGHPRLEKDIESILVPSEEIDGIVTRIARQVDEAYSDSDSRLILLCILKGSVVFMGDLMKKLTIPVEIDFMKISSYGSSTASSGRVNIILDLNRKDLSSCDILIIEDIIDSGKTLSYLTEYLRLNGARSVRSCTLLDKPSRREVDYNPDFVGAEIPDAFVVGYGLDYAEKYRALPYIGILKPEVYGE